MSNAIYPANIRGLAFTVTKTAEFATVVNQSPSKAELRLPLSPNPLWTFQLIYEVIFDRGVLPPYGYSEYRALQGFFLARQGGLDDFLFDDPTDNFVGPAFAGGTISPIAFGGPGVPGVILTTQLDQPGDGYAEFDTMNVSGGDGTALLTINTVSPLGNAITGVNQGTKTFTIAGDWSLDFSAGGAANVLLSTANDGAYTIVSATFSAGSTDVVVVESIPSPIVDGLLYGNRGGVNGYALDSGGLEYVVGANVPTIPVSTSGTGFTIDILSVTTIGAPALNDLSIFPLSSPADTGTFLFTIDGTGSTDTFSFSGPTFGNSAEPITGGYQYVGSGIYIQFRAKTGHTLGSTWTFNVTAGTPNMAAQQQVVTDGLGNYYSPLQRNFGGMFYEDITDLNPPTQVPFVTWAIQVYADGILMVEDGDYVIAGPGLNIPGFQSEGLYIEWLSGAPVGPVTAECFFYFRVRFADDKQDFEQFTKDFWTIGGSEGKNSSQLSLVSARPVFGSQNPS